MNRMLLLPAILATTLFLGACGGDANGSASESAAVSAGLEAAASAELARAEFAVEGMDCGGCVIGTRAALRKLEGVEQADASYDDATRSGAAWALYDPARVTPERMIEAIRELGYTATLSSSES